LVSANTLVSVKLTPALALKMAATQASILPHTRYEGVVNTFVQLPHAFRVWPNRDDSGRKLIWSGRFF
jgi:hypothetical protein